MTREYDRYTYRVTWSEEDREHVGLCAEFPGLLELAGHVTGKSTGGCSPDCQGMPQRYAKEQGRRT